MSLELFSHAGPSSASTVHSPPIPLNRPRPRRRRRRSPTAVYPSPALLAILGALAATQTSNANPLPPSITLPFLCPGGQDCLSHPPLPSPPSRKLNRRTPAGTPRSVPRKYTQGPNGWSLATSWELHGRRLTDPSDSSFPTDASGLDDAGSLPDTPPAFDPAAAIANIDLPSGWETRSRGDFYPKRIVATFSVVLACLIASVIIGCVVWRKKLFSSAQRNKDAEGKGAVEDEDSIVWEEKKKKKKKERRKDESKVVSWAKSSALWKANARLMGRRRKGRRRAEVQDSSIPEGELDISEARTVRSLSTRAPSILVSEHPTSLAAENNSPSTPPSPAPSPNRTLEQDPLPALPPAYRRRFARSATDPSPNRSSASVHSIPVLPTSRPGLAELFPHSTEDLRYEPDSYDAQPNERERHQDDDQAPRDAGHIATDDKAVLARMTTLASAPPSSHHDATPLVPNLDDEGDFPVDEELPGIGEAGPSGASSSFVPVDAKREPPSEDASEDNNLGRLLPLPPTLPSLASKPFTFGQEYYLPFSDALSELGPSAPDLPPPEGASAPPLAFDLDDELEYVDGLVPIEGESGSSRPAVEEHSLTPSAPPPEADEAPSDTQPSAPPAPEPSAPRWEGPLPRYEP